MREEEMEEKTLARKSWEIFTSYVESMLFAFTGGSVALPLLRRKLVGTYRLTTDDEVLEAFALGQSLPGVLSLNSALLLGRSIAGWPGAFAAAAGTILPALAAMLLIALFFTQISGLSIVYGAINGIRAASVAIVFFNAITLSFNAKSFSARTLVLAAFIVTWFFKWNVVLVILLSGLCGAVYAAVTKNADGNSRGENGQC